MTSPREPTFSTSCKRIACAISNSLGDPKSEQSKDAGSDVAARPRATEDAGMRRFAGSPVGDVRQEAKLTGALDGAGELDLMASAGAGDASGPDLALLAHCAADRPEVLVVDDVDLVATERARLEPASAGHALLVTPAVRRPGSTLLCHYLQPTFVCRIVSGRKALESSGGRGTGTRRQTALRAALCPLERDVVVAGA